MALKSGIFNSVNGDRVYKAEDFAAYFASFIGNGVFPNPSNGFQVVSGAGMSVNLKAGEAWINGYYATNDADYNLQLDVADGVLSRIDRVVLQLNYLNRTIIPVVKKGTFASAPVAPAIKRDADAYEIALADIRINKGALSISQANITDLRLNTELCGIVHGVVDQVDTTTIFNQYQSWYGQFTSLKTLEFNDFTETKKQEFDAWFASIQDILVGDVAGNLLTQINEVDQKVIDLTNAVNLHNNDKAAHGIGDRTQLLTNEKNTLIGAMNELFTNANDGKRAVANAVTAKGVTASPSDTFTTLATKIGQINTGKKWASGKLNLRSSDLTEMYFNTLSDASAVFRRLEVGSIPFRPSKIIITVAGGRFHTVVDTEAEKRLDISLIGAGGTSVRLNGNAMVEDRGFKLPIQFDGTGVNTIDWIAFE